MEVKQQEIIESQPQKDEHKKYKSIDQCERKLFFFCFLLQKKIKNLNK